MKAVILILKHATFLQVSTPLESTLTQAELNYQRANIDFQIQQYLKATSTEHTIKEYVTFIMGTDIGLIILESVPIVSDYAFSAILAFICIEKVIS